MHQNIYKENAKKEERNLHCVAAIKKIYISCKLYTRKVEVPTFGYCLSSGIGEKKIDLWNKFQEFK